MSWWTNYPWRMVQTNLREIDMEHMDAEAYADRLSEFGATAVLLNAAGIIASYDTALPFQTQSEYLHGDSLGAMIDACHKRGIRVIARTDFSKVRYPLYEQHPEWACRTKDGDIINYNGDVHVCPNSDYQQHYELEIMKEVLSKFPFDGIFCNMSGFLVTDYSGRFYGPCHCDNCKKKFRDMFGMELPDKMDMRDPAFMKYQQFTAACTKKHREDIVRTVRAINPEIAINGVDYIRTESNTEMGRAQWVYSASMNSRITKGLTGAEDNRPSDNACVDFIGFRYRDISVSPYQVSLRQWQNLANAGSVSLYIMGDLENHRDVSAIKASREAFAFHKAHEELFREQKSLSRVVLVRALPPQYPDPEYQGWVRILTESHIPFDEVKAAELKDISQLGGKDILILGENRMLSPKLAALADAFAEQGGTVIADGMTGISTRKPGADQGRKEAPACMLKCMGIRGVKAVRKDAMSAMFVQSGDDKEVFTRSADTPYLAPGGTIVEIEAAEETKTWLSLVGEHPFGPPERCYYTKDDLVGAPGVTVYEIGQGKGIYLAFRAGTMFMNEGYTNTLTYVQDVLFRLAGAKSLGDGPDLSTMVEVTAKEVWAAREENAAGSDENSPKTEERKPALLVQLVNASGFYGNTFYPPVTMKDVSFTVPAEMLKDAGLCGSKIRNVKALNGGKTEILTDNENSLCIRLDRLEGYEAVLISE